MQQGPDWRLLNVAGGMPLFLKRWKGYHNERTDRIAKRVYKALLVVGVGLSLAR